MPIGSITRCYVKLLVGPKCQSSSGVVRGSGDGGNNDLILDKLGPVVLVAHHLDELLVDLDRFHEAV